MSIRPEIVRGKIYQDVYGKRVGSLPRSDTVAELVIGAITDKVLRFRTPKDLETAMLSGVFLLQIPSDLDVSEVDCLAAEFYDPGTLSPCGSSYRNLTSERFGDPLVGFHERSDQIEQFLLESRFWAGIYPEPVLQFAERLKTISRQIVREALDYAGVPEDSWPVGSGGCSDSAGSYHLTFNHYRPGERQTGLSSHKDDGFVTILRAVEPGLEVNVDQHWEVVPTGPDVLVVNFGLAIEILTRQAPRPISAILHRVVEQRVDRTSYALFSSSSCTPGRDAGIFAYSPTTGLEQICEARQLIFENDHEIYEGTVQPSDD